MKVQYGSCFLIVLLPALLVSNSCTEKQAVTIKFFEGSPKEAFSEAKKEKKTMEIWRRV